LTFYDNELILYAKNDNSLKILIPKFSYFYAEVTSAKTTEPTKIPPLIFDDTKTGEVTERP